MKGWIEQMYVYVPAGLQTRTMNIFFVGYEPTPDPFQGVDFNLEDGAVEVYSPQADPERQTGTLQIPRDRWFCFRARVVISDDRAKGAVQAYVDDALAVLSWPPLADAQGVYRALQNLDLSGKA